MKNILTRINALVAMADAAYADLISHKEGSFDKFLAAQDPIEKEYDAIDKAAGEGLVVGRALDFGVADGSANYLVTKVRKNDVAVVHIHMGDGYTFQGVYDNGKGELCLPRAVAQRQVRMATGLKAMFS